MKKLISMLMAVVLLFTAAIPVFAASSEEEALLEADLYAKTTGLDFLMYDGDVRPATLVVYNRFDPIDNKTKQYPAYCLEPTKPGVGAVRPSYTVSTKDYITNPVIYGIITNGYPYKTVGELGLVNEEQAFYATKMALWTYIRDWDLSKWTPNGAKNSLVLTALKKIYSAGIGNTSIPTVVLTATPETPSATQDSITPSYLSQTYSVLSNADIVSFEVMFAGTPPEGTKITDINNNPKTTFAPDDKFKVLIPGNAVSGKSGSFEVTIKGIVRKNAVLYGMSYDAALQDYAVTLDPLSIENTSAAVNYSNLETYLQIKKLEAGSSKPLAGAVFMVTSLSDGATIGTYTTDANGQITVPLTKSGLYSADEISPPPGYLLSAASHQDVTVSLGQTATVTFVNEPFSGLIIEKRDAGTGARLAGATFRIARQGGTEYTDVTTDAAGMAYLTGLKPGWYTVAETKALSGYVLNSTPQNITLVSGKTATVSFTNSAKPGIHILKVDEATGVVLPGAEFSVAKKGGAIVHEGLTDSNGMIIVENLEPGWYTITELAPPKGYLIATESKDVLLEPGKAVQVKFDNRLRPSLAIVKRDAQTGKPLAGAVFHVQKTGSATVSEYVTDTSGTILIHDLDEAIYSVVEVTAPDGYVLEPQHKDIQLEWGKAKTLMFENTNKPSLTIVKTDAQTGIPLSGARFEVKLVDGQALPGSPYTSGSDGKIIIPALDPGKYQITEIAAPQGYVIDSATQLITLEAGKDGSLSFTNTRKPTLTIRKLDSVTGDPVKGAKFQIWYAENGSLTGNLRDIGVLYTDDSGEIILPKQEVGWYRVTELEPPSGYALKAPSTQDVFLEAGKDKTLTFENIPKSALIIRKTDNETSLPIANAAFRVRYLGGTSGSSGTVIYDGVTSTNGTIVITGLAAGTYIAEEYRPAPGYELPNPTAQTAYISGLEQDVVTLVFTNAHKGGLIIKKLDSVTKQPIKGVTFKVTDSSGGVIGPNNGEYVTDAEGLINIAEHLPIGSTVVVQEIKCPDNYIMDTTAQTVKIAENNTHTLTFYNTHKGGLLIRKYDSVTKQPLPGAVFKVTDSSGAVVGTGNGEYSTDRDGVILIPGLKPGTYVAAEVKAPAGYLPDTTPQTISIPDEKLYTLTFVNVPQPGLQILKLDEETRRPVAGVEFAVSRMNGEKIGTYRTDDKGLITLTALAAGWYTATETKAAKGYLLDTTPHNIELKEGVSAVLTVTNRKTSGIIIHKIDSVTKKGIYGVTFLLYDEYNNPAGQYESDQDGCVYIGNGLADGKYKIREFSPAKGYAADDTVRTIYLEYGRTTEITWENVPVRGQIIVTKRSAQYNEVTGLPAGAPLAGAMFEVVSTAGNVVDRIVSDSRGVAASKPLPLGIYFIREVIPPKYYALNPREFWAELKHNGDIARFECLDENVTLGVTIQKKSQNQAAPGQTIYYDLFGIANTSSVALENFYVHDRLPTDAVRGSKIFTGTWSDRLTYRVTYKTNYSTDYKVLASGLSTKVSYELSIHPNVLGLANGEYVTDIRFEFGTVPTGFKSVENPKLMVQVLPTLPKDYKIVNRADVGGLYINEWETANCSWTTVVVGGFNPPELPKTGYARLVPEQSV